MLIPSSQDTVTTVKQWPEKVNRHASEGVNKLRLPVRNNCELTKMVAEYSIAKASI
jgi:hypothetical protein